MRYKEVVRSFLESQSNKEYDTNPHSQLHILSQPEVIPNNSGGKENWYIKFITHYMSNLNIPGGYVPDCGWSACYPSAFSCTDRCRGRRG